MDPLPPTRPDPGQAPRHPQLRPRSAAAGHGATPRAPDVQLPLPLEAPGPAPMTAAVASVPAEPPPPPAPAAPEPAPVPTPVAAALVPAAPPPPPAPAAPERAVGRDHPDDPALIPDAEPSAFRVRLVRDAAAALCLMAFVALGAVLLAPPQPTGAVLGATGLPGDGVSSGVVPEAVASASPEDASPAVPGAAASAGPWTAPSTQPTPSPSPTSAP